MRVIRVNVRKAKRKNGYAYFLDYWVHGERIRETVSTNKKIANLKASDIEVKLNLGKLNILPKENKIISIDNLISEFLLSLRHEIRPNTVIRYKNHFVPLQSFLNTLMPEVASNVSLFKTQYFIELIDYVKDKYCWSPVTINRMRQMISSLFIFAIKREYIIKNPISDTKNIPVPEKDKPPYFKKDDLSKIWETVDPFWMPFLRFDYYTGLRKGELINLTWDRVNLNSNIKTIKVIAHDDWIPKTGRSRLVPLNKNAVQIINNQVGIHEKYVFISKSNTKIHPNAPYIAIKRALKILNLSGDVHKLRHTFASHLVMKGVSIYEIKELLGHSDIKMTQKYAHLSPTHQESVVNLLEDD